MRHLALLTALVVASLNAAPPSHAQTKPPPKREMRPSPPITVPPASGAIGAIEGEYDTESGERIVVTSLGDNVYRLVSNQGWQGVGMRLGGLYRGVFRYDSTASHDYAGSMGDHLVDWRDPQKAAVTMTIDGQSKSINAAWRRVGETQFQPIGTGPAAAATTSGRPGPNDYVYVDELPEATMKSQPEYPAEAAKVGATGTVLVRALVLEDGSVADCRIVKSIPTLDQAAKDCVKQWRFKPARAQGKPTAVWVDVPLLFSGHH